MRKHTTTMRTQHAMTVVELLVALTLTSFLAAALVSGLTTLRRVVALQNARYHLVLALHHAATLAYRRGTTVSVATLDDGSGVTIHADGIDTTTITLPVGSRITRSPQRGGVHFFAGGLADNATFIVALDGNDEDLSVIVNQRGRIR